MPLTLPVTPPSGPEPSREDHALLDADRMVEFPGAEHPNTSIIDRGCEALWAAIPGKTGEDTTVSVPCPNVNVGRDGRADRDAVDLTECRFRTVINPPALPAGDVSDQRLVMVFSQSHQMAQREVSVRDGSSETHDIDPRERCDFGQETDVLGLLQSVGDRVVHRMDFANSDRIRQEKEAHWPYIDGPLASANRAGFPRARRKSPDHTHPIALRRRTAAVHAGIVHIPRVIHRGERVLVATTDQTARCAALRDVLPKETAGDPTFNALGDVLRKPNHPNGRITPRKTMPDLVRDHLTAHCADQPHVSPAL